MKPSFTDRDTEIYTTTCVITYIYTVYIHTHTCGVCVSTRAWTYQHARAPACSPLEWSVVMGYRGQENAICSSSTSPTYSSVGMTWFKGCPPLFLNLVVCMFSLTQFTLALLSTQGLMTGLSCGQNYGGREVPNPAVHKAITRLFWRHYFTGLCCKSGILYYNIQLILLYAVYFNVWLLLIDITGQAQGTGHLNNIQI